MAKKIFFSAAKAALQVKRIKDANARDFSRVPIRSQTEHNANVSGFAVRKISRIRRVWVRIRVRSCIPDQNICVSLLILLFRRREGTASSGDARLGFGDMDVWQGAAGAEAPGYWSCNSVYLILKIANQYRGGQFLAIHRFFD